MAENRLGVGKISFPFGMDNNLKIALEDLVSRVDDTTNYLIKPSVSVFTSSASITDVNSICLCNATSGAFNITLPDASVISGKQFTIKKIDASANAVTVIGTIDGGANYSLATQNKYVSVVSDGTNWHIISNN